MSSTQCDVELQNKQQTTNTMNKPMKLACAALGVQTIVCKS